MNARPYGVWARSILSPRTRLLPGIGARLAGHPRLAASIFAALRRLPGRRLRIAAYRHVSRPLVQRMDARLVVPVTGGARLIVDTSDVVGRVLATSGIWEPHVTAVFQELLSSGDVCVDVGAHVGYYTLLASRLVGADGHVYALEPAPAMYAELCSNLALNDVSNVTPLCVAAGAGEGDALLLNTDPANSGASFISTSLPSPQTAHEPPSAVATVPVRSVASVVRPADLDRIRLVKIDVEGYEANVLRGVAPLFESGEPPALIVELHPESATDAAELLERLSVAHALDAYEIVRGGNTADRFSPRVSLRALPPAEGLVSIADGRYYNILLASHDRLSSCPAVLRAILT